MGLSVHDPFVDPLGNPLGLARNTGPATLNPASIDVLTSQAVKLPKGYSFFRVIVVGAGGNGSVSGGGGGGGGGYSESPILDTRLFSEVQIEVASALTSAKFGSWTIQATKGGNAQGSIAGAGGIGSGGFRNSSGGSGGTGFSGFGAGGGGAGGPDGDGGLGGTGNAAPAYGRRGGGGGSGMTSSGGPGGGGGGGVNAKGGDFVIPGTNYQEALGSSPAPVFGLPGSKGGVSTAGGNGGLWGGGGGGGGTGTSTIALGGAGGVRIELW